MAFTSLFTLLDDITSVLDDVATMTKVATKNTAGVLGDDLALNAEQVIGVKADRELPIIAKVALGSLINKVILVPIALLIWFFIPWLIQPLLMLGGAYLCFEGVEKVWYFLKNKFNKRFHSDEVSLDIADEKSKIIGAIRTDFILSAEIITIALGTMTGQTLTNTAIALSIVAVLITVFVYGLVAVIVKLDDVGLWLSKKPHPYSQKIGKILILAMPLVMRTLSVIGTVAMFLVGGGIILHGTETLIPIVHHYIEAQSLPLLIIQLAFGIIVGLVIVLLVWIIPYIIKIFPEDKPQTGNHWIKLPEILNQILKYKVITWLIVIIAGAVTPLSFAPYRQFWIMPISLGVLLMMTVLFPKRAVSLAFIWAFVGYLLQNYWVDIALHDVGGLDQMIALPLSALLPLYLALYPALCFWLLEKFRCSKSIKLVIVFPALWTITEYLRANLLTGFGWGEIGYSQIANSPLAGFAPIGGVHLVTLVVAMVCAWVVYALLTRSFLRRVVAICIPITLFSLGFHFSQILFTEPDDTSATIALVQGNVPQSLKFDESKIAKDIQMYYQQVAKINHADITILPETAIPIATELLPKGFLSQFASTAKRNHTALAVGIFHYLPEKGYQNAVLNLSQYNPNKSQDTPYYAKNHLVPFGEYHPLPILTDKLYQMLNIPLSDLITGGSQQEPLQLANQKVAFNICYEDSFGDELIHTASQSSLLANVSNMAWYGHSNAMDLQLQHSQTRALEMGRYMVRATNTGLTAVINPHGKITALIPRDTRQTLYASIQGYKGQTPYMKMGGSHLIIALLSTVLILIWLINLLFIRHHQQIEKRKHMEKV